MFPIIRKIKKQILRALVFIVSTVLFCMLNISAAATWNSVTVKAAEPVGGKGISFDAEGNFYMTVYDKIATSATTYTTLGWTLKRYPGDSGGESVRVKLVSYRENEPDPENPLYCYSYYMISKEVIYQKISQCSPEWAQQLYLYGGTLYLDGIMTVKENGIPQGVLYEDGSTSGEVYTTFEGIAGARAWYDKDALRSHFDKEVYFGGNPAMLDTSAGDASLGEKIEEIAVSSSIGRENLSSVNKMNIFSADYNVERSIPSGEKVDISGEFQKYYYNAVYLHCYGTVKIPVTANVTYTLVWNDGKAHSETVTVQEQYEIKRSYSYWRIKELNLYYLNSVTLENQALPDGKVVFSNCYQPQISLVTNQGEYKKMPETEVSIQGGTIYGGTKKPSVSEKNNEPLVDEKIGQIMVKNDGFSVDGEVWLIAGEKETQTQEPETLSGERKITISKTEVEIPKTVENEVWQSAGTAEYAEYNLNGFGTGRQNADISNINSISVHTPVICIGLVSDDIAFNQQVVPTKKKSLILGRNVTVSISSTGTHINEKGYGTQNYQRYAASRQVSFPFPVQFDGKTISKDTWITLNKESVTFQIPVSVPERDYEISFRSIAINAGVTLETEKSANLQQANDTAVDTVAVRVIGRLADFRITNVIDYPRWQNVFWNIDKTERTGTAYFSGLNNMNGQKQRETTSIYLLPLLKGSHPESKNIHAPGLGYRMTFSLQTIGSMQNEKDYIQLTPTYYFVDRDGKNRQQVNLYEAENLTQYYETLTLTKKNRSILKNGVQCWEGSYKLPAELFIVNVKTDLKTYVEKKNGRIKTTDPVFLRDGYLIVHFDIVSWEDGKANLSYENQANVSKGYCDMWKVEGYQTKRTDADGYEFQFLEGDVFVFDLQNSMLTDYESIGTH